MVLDNLGCDNLKRENLDPKIFNLEELNLESLERKEFNWEDLTLEDPNLEYLPSLGLEELGPSRMTLIGRT